MRGARTFAAVLAALWLASCAPAPAHEYPAEAATAFHQLCPAESPECVCVWEEITRAMPHEEYEAAMARFETEGLMDPRITQARGKCRAKHGNG